MTKPLDDRILALSKQLLVASGHRDYDAVVALLSKGADPNYRNAHGETPLFAAAEGGSLKIIQYLLEKGAKIDANLNKTISDQHLIHNACSSGNDELVQFLAQKGQSLSVQAYDGSTPLHIAVRMGQVKVVDWLLQQKTVSPNKSDYGGFTPMHVAAMMTRLRKQCLELLVDAGAKMNSTTFRGDTPLHLAAHKPDVDLLTYMIERGAKIECIACERLKPCDGVDEKTQVFIKHETERTKGRKKEIKKQIEEEKKKKKDDEKRRKAEEERRKAEEEGRRREEQKRSDRNAEIQRRSLDIQRRSLDMQRVSNSGGGPTNASVLPNTSASPALAVPSVSVTPSSGRGSPVSSSPNESSGPSKSPARGSTPGAPSKDKDKDKDKDSKETKKSRISNFFSHKRSASATGTSDT